MIYPIWMEPMEKNKRNERNKKSPQKNYIHTAISRAHIHADIHTHTVGVQVDERWCEWDDKQFVQKR